MIQDLHSHTYYSFCGRDNPEDIVKAAIDGGIELFGITDHAHGAGHGRKSVYKAAADGVSFREEERMLTRYYDHMDLVRHKYRDRINILCGIEVNTQGSYPNAALPEGVDISFFDYCLIENLDDPLSITGGDLFTFAKRCGCAVKGVAHTDLFTHIIARGEEPLDYFKRMAEENIFWEMNVTYDSIHKYIEHPYMLEFFRNEAQQETVRASGVKLSIGFDGHRVEDYRPDRVAEFCRRVEALGIPLAFADRFETK